MNNPRKPRLSVLVKKKLVHRIVLIPTNLAGLGVGSEVGVEVNAGGRLGLDVQLQHAEVVTLKIKLTD